jgi:hypothetical protein
MDRLIIIVKEVCHCPSWELSTWPEGNYRMQRIAQCNTNWKTKTAAVRNAIKIAKLLNIPVYDFDTKEFIYSLFLLSK